MNEKLIEKINQWHEESEHNNIIQLLEELPEMELSYPLKNLLGRAYNNISDYGTALEILLSESAAGDGDVLWNFRVGYAYYYRKEPQLALSYFQRSAALGDSSAQNFVKWCIQDLDVEKQKTQVDKSEDLDKRWYDFTSQFVDKLSHNNEDWNALSEQEQELAALWKLEMDMYNGGFIQFFCNWGSLCYKHAIRALKRMKAEKSLAIIEKQYQIIQRLEDNKEIQKLWDIPKYLTAEELDEISEVLDLQYWDTEDHIIEKTFTAYSELMNTSEEKMENKSTLNKIAWSFSSKHYTDAEAFNQEILHYQKLIYDTDERWNPTEIVFDGPEVQIQYEAWIMEPGDLLENDSLFADDKDIFDQDPEEAGYQVEIVSKLKADNGQNFTALEFLMKAHNQQANKELGDHVFFEGIDDQPTLVAGVPTYYIACGS